MIHLAIYECSDEGTKFVGKGNTLNDAFESVKEQVKDNYESRDGWEPDDVEFFRAEKLKVEYTLVEVEQPVVITKAPLVKAAAPVKARKK